MKILRKSFVCFLLIGLIPCLLLLSACGNTTKYAWEKKFAYQGVVVNQWDSYAPGGSKIIDLLKDEFKKNNLDFKNAEVNGESFDMSSAKNMSESELITYIESLAKSALDKTFKNKINVKVGKKEDLTININGTDYPLKPDETYSYYDILDSSNKVIGFFEEVMPTKINNVDTSNCVVINLNEFSSYTSCSIIIPTSKVINDNTATKDIDNGIVIKTKLSINFTAYLSEVK